MSGSFDRAASARHASLPKKALTIILSLLFALALVPTAAWAQLAPSEQQDAATESVEAISGEEAPSDETAEEAPAEDTEAPLEEDPAVAGDAAVSGDEGVSETEGSVEEAADVDAAADETVDGEAVDAGALNSVEAAQPADADADSSDEAAISATASVIGRDAAGELETWAASAGYDLPGGSTAADLTEAMLEAAGLVADYDPNGQYGFSLNTITSPANSTLTLGWDEATGRYWQMFVNGEPSGLGASSVILQPGDKITWYYAADGESLPAEQITVMGWLVGIDGQGHDQTWIPVGGMDVPVGTTAAEFTEEMLERNGVESDIYTPETHGYWMLNAVTSPREADLTLSYNPDTWEYWQFFVNGELSSVGADQYTLEDRDLIIWY